MARHEVLLVEHVPKRQLHFERLPALQLLRPALHDVEARVPGQYGGVGLVGKTAALDVDASPGLGLRVPRILPPQALTACRATLGTRLPP